MTWHICCDEGEWEPIFWRSFGFGWFFCYDDYFKAFGRQVVYIGIPTKNEVCLVKVDLERNCYRLLTIQGKVPLRHLLNGRSGFKEVNDCVLN